MRIRQQAFRYQLTPSREQQRKMRQFAGCARYVFNRAGALQNQQREKAGRKQSGYAALCKLLTAWRNDPETAWLGECPVHAAFRPGTMSKGSENARRGACSPSPRRSDSILES